MLGWCYGYQVARILTWERFARVNFIGTSQTSVHPEGISAIEGSISRSFCIQGVLLQHAGLTGSCFVGWEESKAKAE